jgi:uncharacterized membrane protein
MSPQLVAHLMSFLTLGIFWNGQQAQLSHLHRSDWHLTWVHIAFLFTVSLTPFSTRLLAEFITWRTALLWYWINILLSRAALFLSGRCAVKSNLIKSDTPAYLGGAGALCDRGIALPGKYLREYRRDVLVQLNFAFGPQLGWLSRF